MNPKRVVFIVGAGRSGSTVLDKFMGSHSQAFPLGEVFNFSKMVRLNGFCSCEKRICECEFYNSIIKTTNAEDEMFNTLFFYRDKNIFFTILNIIRMLASLLIGVNILSKEAEKTLENNSKLLEKISEKSGMKVYIDSSKNIVRALLLEKFFLKRFECKYVFLVRDPIGNVYSQAKNYIVNFEFKNRSQVKNINTGNKRPISKAISSWRFHNVLTLVFLKFFVKNNNYKVVKYEKFIREHKKVFKELFPIHFLNWENSMENLDNKEHHIIGGNVSKINAKRIKKRSIEYEKYFSENELKLIKKKLHLP